MLQYLLRWIQCSNAGKCLSKEGGFKAEARSSDVPEGLKAFLVALLVTKREQLALRFESTQPGLK